MQELLQAGFTRLEEQESWSLQAGERYFVERNGSSLLAFTWPDDTPEKLTLVGAHTDSPCLRLMPDPLILSEGSLCLRVQVYGGVLLYPWFDRDLGLAGRLVIGDASNTQTVLVNTQEPLGIIPSLAIHLDRNANAGRTVNPHTEMRAVVGMANRAPEMSQWLGEVFPGLNAVPLAWELSLYDFQPPARVGDGFITSARLDNQLSCYAGTQALLNAPTDRFCMLVCHDHEEVGSRSWAGAQGDMVVRALERLVPDADGRARLLACSCMLSVDNAHAVHPNFASHHDAGHRPLLGHGPVLKLDAEQRYAGDSQAWARLKVLAEQHDIPLQVFAVRPDMACGSTIGPISAANLGMQVLDVGAPQWAMHSIRETAHYSDVQELQKLIQTFYSHYLGD